MQQQKQQQGFAAKVSGQYFFFSKMIPSITRMQRLTGPPLRGGSREAGGGEKQANIQNLGWWRVSLRLR